MSPSAPQPDYAAPVIQEFLEWISKHGVIGTKGPSVIPNCSFMPLPDLNAYLKAESRTSKLLRALYPDRDHELSIEYIESWHPRAFTILTLMGKGTYIEDFVQHHNLRDSHLPFLEKPSHFPIDPNDPKFWEKFYQRQFAFCAHYFRYNENRTMIEDPCILPIISKEVLGQGGSAAIYKIKLHSHYDQLNPYAEDSRALDARPANTYVLKTYNTKNAHSYFTSEVNAFKKLATKNGNDHSLIQFLGSYKQGDSYNILLEYADRGTLEDFFQKAVPPSRGEEIIMFWGRLFNVIKALSRIHITERHDGFRGPDILIGWHQDVKPRNILVLSGKSNHPFDVEFKLADLGLSHFKRTTKLDRGTTDGDIGGTKDYGAPECHRSDAFLEQSKINVSPSIDIWSFGGICSEAAVWVVLGMPGLIKYRQERQQEIYKHGTVQDGSCFHDGENVLDTVKDMHRRLMKDGEVRPKDHVTRPVLDQMVTSMLEESPGGRQNATWLWKKSQKIIDEAQKELAELPPEKARRQVNSMDNVGQYFGTNTQTTPPPISHEATQPYRESSQAYGPPPNYPQYSSAPQVPGRSSFNKLTSNKRSHTFHQQNVQSNLTSHSLYESLSSPIAIGHSQRTSPPVDQYPVVLKRIEAQDMAFDKTATANGEHSWQNGGGSKDQITIASEGSNSLENEYVPHPTARGFPTPRTEFDTRVRPTQQSQYNSSPAPASDHHNRAFGPSLESNPLHSPVTSIPTSYKPHPTTNTTSGVASQNPPEKPFLTYQDAKQIRESHGRLPFEGHLNDLKNRDHVFLIDDSISMKDHWDDVVSLFSVLAYIAKRLDNDKLEMYFTVSKNEKTFKDTTPAVSHLKNTKPDTCCNFNMRLMEILRSYQQNLEPRVRKRFSWSRSKVAKPLSLYVFTDAAWQGCDGVAPVEAMIEKLKKLELPKGQVGIQFIRFGNDETGIKRLEYLDSGLRRKYTKEWDIVDTEPYKNGNLLKMLLGPISPWYDNDEPD